jgi:SAM-dependent methyltransferase
MEINHHSAQIARQRLDLVIEESIEKIVWPDPRLPDAGFDTILLADVLEHLFNPWEVLKAVRRLVKPGGRIVASIPNIFNLRVLNDLARGHWHYAPSGLLDITHLRFFTAETMHRMFEETGYRVMRMEGLKHTESELPPHVRPNQSSITTDYLTLRNQPFGQVDRLFMQQFVVVAVPNTAEAANDSIIRFA